MARKLQNLKQKRKQYISSLNRIKEYSDQIYNREITETEYFEIQARLAKLSPICEQFEAIQSEIEIVTDFSDSEEEFREEFEIKYFTLHAKLQEKINKFKTNSSSEPTPTQVLPTPVQLPLMNLPTFNGEYHRWQEFRDTFLALIGNNKSLTNVQKFYHLRSCLHKNVLETIQALPVTNDNYHLAFNQLKDRYEREHLITSNHVNAILNFPKIFKESSAELRKLHNCVHNNLEALKNIGVAIEHWDLMLIPIISSKLDPVTIREWEKLSVSKTVIKFQELLTLINNRAEFLERMESNKQTLKPNFDKKPIIPINKISTALHVESEVSNCKICNGNHPVFRCISFLKLSINERKQKVKERGLCINCLKSSHSVNQCTSSKCRKCGNPHNTLLHFESSKTSSKPERVDESTTVATTQIHSKGKANSLTQNQVILPTAIVLVADQNNQWYRCRALLDSGAMSNFISRDLYQRLNLPVKNVNCSIRGVGSSVQTAQHEVKVTLTAPHGNKQHFETTCLILDKITSNLPLISFNKSKLKIPGGVRLADPTFNESSAIDLLLGSSMFWELLKDRQIKIPHTNLTLKETKLGWIVGGLTFSKNSKIKSQIKHSVNCATIIETSLEDQVRKFWEIEEVGSPKVMSPEDQFCEESFSQTHCRDQDGRFIVKIPFKSNVKQLGLSKHLALKRFEFLERKLMKNKSLRSEYSKIMREYQDMGHMREITDEEPNFENLSYYIPHHSVSRNESLTTKVRVVFDASMSTTSGLSLNDVQYIGPTIQNDLFSILINFRLHKYVISSDISKMYRMVWLHKDHKPFHRIFWRETPSEPLKCYELQTVTFGTASAPFLAIRCLHQLAAESSRQHPKSSEVIKNNFYVDDLIYGSESLDDLIQVQHEVTKILASAGFFLRKWLCNNNEIYSKLKLNPELECNTLQFGDKEQKTLGVAWNVSSDEILYSNYQFGGSSVTKRLILSELSKIFDPLGLLGPILVVGKLLMQRLWQEQISWDEPISAELSSHWLEFQNNLNNIQLLKINRKVLIDDYESYEIHGFCDASQRAYGACIFIRSQNKAGAILTRLLCSKSRIAPIKTISLPRLELNSALLLAHLVRRVLEKIEIKPKNVFYWTDSTITLAWIKGNPSRWKTFVANRVGEIQQLTDIKGWYHVSSSENAADILSRGATVNQLVNSEIWWSGPSWLSSKEIPFNPNFPISSEIPEEKILVHLNIEISCDLINRYSNFQKLLRITAYCFRFKENCKLSSNQRKLGDLTVEELKSAKNTLLRLMQRETFPKEYQNLQSSKPLHKQSRLLSLNPFLDNNNLIRVGGRLDKTQLSFESKHPVILAPGHQLTKLIIKQIHNNNFHCGPTALLSFVRQNYWPINGRQFVKGIVRECRICLFAKPKPVQYLMGQLPACRATKNFPFENVGIDYAGPILIKDRKTRNSKTLKAYICLFVCMTTKAIHLECVTDLSTEAFILCLKRFISRRGKPANIYSDNAKNFVGANAEIKRLFTYIKQNFHNIHSFLANQEIVWHFIPARSPSFGGIWEAGIKSVKSHLNKVTKNIKFDYEQFSTLLCQIEAILNSRPLTPLSTDPSDLTPLTPGHFLIGRSLNQHPEISHPSLIPTSRLKKFKSLEAIIQQFWKRWSLEYIHELQVRSKWNKQQDAKPPQVGQLVLLKEDTHPIQWPLGRIIELHPGNDGITRVVSVKVRGGITKRGVSKICLLPEEI